MFFKKKEGNHEFNEILTGVHGFTFNKKDQSFTRETSRNKQILVFGKKCVSITVHTNLNMGDEDDEARDDFIWDALDVWASRVANELSLVVLYSDGAGFEYQEKLNTVNLTSVLSLLDRITKKYNDVAEDYINKHCR